MNDKSSQLVQLGARSASAQSAAELREPPADAPRVYIETYGCQMNVADSDMLVGMLADAGMRRAHAASEADVILINTCAVREKAEDRVFARAAELGAQKKKRDVVLAITGCMAEHLKERLLERAPAVDIVAGPDSYRRIPELIARVRARSNENHENNENSEQDDGAPLVDVRLDKAETYEGLSGAEGGDGMSGFITIQRGCDKFCTFCVVPFTRGRERGAAPREILRQVRAFRDAGYKELVLLGQTVNSYRYEDVSFAELLRSVAKVDGIERIRFTSPYPVDFTTDVIDAIASEPKICNQLHLPLQSGADSVLERMRRGYTVDDYRAIISELRAKIPDIALSTDILSGFHGETDEEHAATLELMRELRFDSAFMFMYSERDLTHAAKKQPDDVPMAVKKRRIAEIIALQETISTEINAALVGSTQRMMIHKPSKRDPNQMVGRTDGFKAVIVPAAAGGPGDLIDVVIERTTMATLFGRPT